MLSKVLFEKKTTRRLLALCWALLIGLLSTRVQVNAPQLWSDWLAPDKVAHFLTYALLAWLTIRAWPGSGHKPSLIQLTATALACSLYGLWWEIVQFRFFPDRHFEWADMTANVLGVFAGLFFFVTFIRRTKPAVLKARSSFFKPL